MTSHPSAPPGLTSTLRSADGKGVVNIEVRIAAGVDAVWSAVTDPRQLGRWLGAFEGDLRLGGGFRARFFASAWEGTGRVEVCDPPRAVRVRMTEAGATVADSTEVTLTAEGEHTRVVVEQRGVPLDLLAAFGAGLQVHVEDLAAHLAGGERCDGRARWGELFPAYKIKASALPAGRPAE